MQTRPIATASIIGADLEKRNMNLSGPTIYTAIKQLEKLGIIRETTGKERNRLYIYDAYMKILDEGTKPISRESDNLEETEWA